MYDHNVFCLSEFEYRSEESQIFFNTIELVVVSKTGQFCVPYTGRNPDLNLCVYPYLYKNTALYYGSVDPTTGYIQHFRDVCNLVQFDLYFHNNPV